MKDFLFVIAVIIGLLTFSIGIVSVLEHFTDSSEISAEKYVDIKQLLDYEPAKRLVHEAMTDGHITNSEYDSIFNQTGKSLMMEKLLRKPPPSPPPPER